MYILQCNDSGNTLYTGITNNLDKRIDMHNKGSGAKYTKGRGPVILLKSFEAISRSEASKREYEIKKMTRAEKWKLINESEAPEDYKIKL